MKQLLREPAALSHLSNLQGVINRLASSSASSKAWCLTLVTALLALGTSQDKPIALRLAFVPTLLFLILDAYYLSLERDFREIYNDFVKKPSEDKLFVMPLPRQRWHRVGGTLESIVSFSASPFYVVVLGAILVVHLIAK